MMKERTNPKSVAPHKVKGTVLFTVVCVMMVLIVFLMGAMALSATANKRAMKNYSEAQTQATARAGVHALMSAIQNDVNAAKAASELDGTTKSVISFGEDDIAFESDMVWDATQKKYVGSNASAMGKITSAEIRYVGHKYILSGDELKDKAVIKFSATAQQGDAESTYSVYMLRDIVDDDNGGGGGGGGGFVSTGAAGASNHTSALGGTYIGFDKIDDVTKLPTHKTNFEPGNEAIFEAPMQVYGNFQEGLDYGNLRVGKVDLVVEPGTGLTVWGDINLTGQNGSGINILTVNATKDKMKDESYTKIPYIFCDGAFKYRQGSGKLGDPNIPLNIFCDEFFKYDGGTQFFADVYAFKADGTSVFGATGKNIKNEDVGNGGSTTLAKWTARVVNADGNKEDHEGGNFYTKGNLEVAHNATLDGNLYVEGNLVFKNGAKLTMNGGKSIIVKKEISGSGQIETTGAVCTPSITGVTLPNGSEIPRSDVPADAEFPKQYEKKAILGNDPNFKNGKIISTVSDIMETKINPFSDSMITKLSDVPEKGTLDANIAKISGNKDHAQATIIKGSGFISASEPDIIITDSCTIYGVQRGGKLIFKPKDGKNIWVRIAGGAKATESGTIAADDYSGGFELDTCTMYLDDGSGGQVNLFLTSDMKYSGANGKTMWTKKLDDAFAGASNKGFEVYTDKDYSINNADYPQLKAIGINLYSDTDTHTLDMGDGTYTMAVNILAPYLKLKHKPGAPSIYGYADNSNFKIYYNGLELHENDGEYTGSVFTKAFTTKVGIIGCCVINELESDNDWALLYVPQDTGNKKKKKTDLEDALLVGWQTLYYENY